MQHPQPTPSPFRSQVDALLEVVARGWLASLGPVERTAISLTLRRRGWAFAALSRHGPLSGVSDAALVQLLSLLSEEVDGILVDYAADVAGDDDPTPTEALEQLRAALAAGSR